MSHEKFKIITLPGENSFPGWIDLHSRMFRGVLVRLGRLSHALPNMMEQHRLTKENDLARKLEILNSSEKTEFQNAYADLDERLSSLTLESSLSISPNAHSAFLDHLEAKVSTVTYPVFVRNMALVYVVSRFEDLIARNLETLFIFKPELLRSKEKTLTYEEILQYATFEELRTVIVKKEIETVLREDINTIERYLNQRGILTLKGKLNWSDFTERFYRRNNIIHKDAKINEIYIAKTGRNQPQELEVDHDYLIESMKLFEECSSDMKTKILGKFG